MNPYEWLQTILFFVVLLALVKPLGSFMARVFQGERTFLSPVLSPCENFIYRISGVKPEIGQQFGRFLELILVIDPDAPAIGLFEFEEALDLLHVEVVSKNTRGLLIRQMADQSHSVVGGEERRVRTANQRATGG